MGIFNVDDGYALGGSTNYTLMMAYPATPVFGAIE